MALKDILLHIGSYPDATPAAAITEAAGFAAASGAALTALAVRVDFDTPTNWLAERMIDFKRLSATQEAESLAICEAGLTTFRASVTALGVKGEGRIVQSDPFLFDDELSRQARTHDLCLIPIANPADGQRSIAEAVVFNSGRPVILFSAGGHLTNGPGAVVIAWDGSPAAARALGGSVALLSCARQVRIVSVLHEKPGVASGIGADVVRHLAAHGIEATADEVDAAGRPIGEVLETYAAEQNADLIVMGAFGHARLREFVLGGATAHLMRRSKIPILMAH